MDKFSCKSMTYPTCDQIMVTSWKGQRLWVPLSNAWLKFYRKLDRLQTMSTHVQHATKFLVTSLKGPTLCAPLSILQPKVDRFNCKLDWWCPWSMTMSGLQPNLSNLWPKFSHKLNKSFLTYFRGHDIHSWPFMLQVSITIWKMHINLWN